MTHTETLLNSTLSEAGSVSYAEQTVVSRRDELSHMSGFVDGIHGVFSSTPAFDFITNDKKVWFDTVDSGRVFTCVVPLELIAMSDEDFADFYKNFLNR